MPKKEQPEILGPDAFLRAITESPNSFRERYKDDPLGLAKRLGLEWPKKPVQIMQELGVYDPEKHGPITPGIRDMVYDVCTLKVTDAAGCTNRGGSKSYSAAFIEFFLVFILGFDALNLGGSELQADQVYQYLLSFIDKEEDFKRMVKGDPQKEKTFTTDGNWIRVLTASTKSVRSPHAGGRKRDGTPKGGILVIDEEAEAEKEIVEAALSTINTARPSVSVRISTFHKIGGSFQELIDNHVEMGYTLYNQDIFDCAERCSCPTDKCESPEPCFREDHYETVLDPETGKEQKRLIHKSYCNSRSRYSNGWIPQEEILKLWRRMKRNHAQWEVEAMGSRPSTSGHVIKDIANFNRNITNQSSSEMYAPGYPITIAVDWGTTACGIEVWQEQIQKHVLLHAELFLEGSQTETFNKILNLANLYFADFKEVAADVGGGGNYLNPKLREEAGLPVRDVHFNEEKEAAVAAWNILNEANQCAYPDEFTDFLKQVRNWKRSSNGRIAKGNDHLCDCGVVYFSGYIEPMGLSHIRILPKTFSSGVGPPKKERHQDPSGFSRPVMRTIGSKRR